jgi:hypothetical protein
MKYFLIKKINCYALYHSRLPPSNYFYRIPRIPPYQTTPFTIDPSARSTQTFAERYGISPPHSTEDLYGNVFVTSKDDKKIVTTNEQQSVIIDGEKDHSNKPNLLSNSSAFDVELLQVSFQT